MQHKWLWFIGYLITTGFQAQTYHLQIKMVAITCKFLKLFTKFPTFVNQIHHFLPDNI